MAMTLDYRETEGQWVTPNGRPIVFRYRTDTNDWNTISSCLGDNDEYGLRGLKIDGPVVDVGGYLGSFGVTAAVDNPEAQVWIVEPVPYNAALIRQNAERNGVSDRVTVIEGAVGIGGESVDVWYGYRGTVTAEHHAFVGNSSLAYDHGGELEHDATTYVALGLDELVALAGGRIALLKIDCEGGEWPFLVGESLGSVERIVGEAHAVRGHEGRDIIALLAVTHDVTLQPVPEDPEGKGTTGFTAVVR